VTGKRNRRGGLAVLLALLAFAPARADEAPRYSLDWALRVGLTNSIAAQNAVRDRAIADTRVAQARSEALPTFALGASYTRLDELETVDFGSGDGPVEVGTLDNYTATAGLSQLLYAGGRVGAALRAARLSRALADAERAEVETELVRDIRIGFYDLLLARDTVEVNAAALEQLEALLEQTRSRYEAGTASEYDLLTARVRAANARPPLIRARNAYAVGRQAFLRLLGLDDPAFEPAGELSFTEREADADALIREALRARPLVERARTVVRLREEDLVAARSGTRPDLRARASYSGANSYGFVSFDDDWEWHWNAGLVLSWDLWDGGLTRGLVDEKRYERDKSIALLEDVGRAVRTEVRSACLDLARAAEAVEAGRGTVALAEKGLAIARSRYENGLATYLEYTDSTVALSTARLSERQALRDHAAAWALLRYAVGKAEDD
jgi:outer membrane protein